MQKESDDMLEIVNTVTTRSLSCKKYTTLCGHLLGLSTDADYCVYNTDDGNQFYSNDMAYQISQHDLYDLETTCAAAMTSLKKGESLESYLIKQHMISAKRNEALSQLGKLAIISACVVGFVICLVSSIRIRRVPKKKQRQRQRQRQQSSFDAKSGDNEFLYISEDGHTLSSGDYSCCTNDDDFTLDGQYMSSGSETRGLHTSGEEEEEEEEIGSSGGNRNKTVRWLKQLRGDNAGDDKKENLVTSCGGEGETTGGDKDNADAVARTLVHI
jgi:hypothetical protein